MREYVGIIDSLNTELIEINGTPIIEEAPSEIDITKIEVPFILDTNLNILLSNYEKGVTTYGGSTFTPRFQEPHLIQRKVLFNINPEQIQCGYKSFVLELYLFVNSNGYVKAAKPK